MNFGIISSWLLPERALWIPASKILAVADVHLGKVSHFRKAGFQLPVGTLEGNINRLRDLMFRYEPEQLVIVGDFFHSSWNAEWPLIQKWRSNFPLTEVHLVKGNHDILSETAYQSASITLHNKTLELGEISFEHHVTSLSPDRLQISGHIHPGLKLQTSPRAYDSVPAFVFRNNNLILPAFGEFTGNMRWKPEEGDRLFAVTAERVFEL